MKRILSATIAALVLATLPMQSTLAQGASFPSKTITIIRPTAPGGSDGPLRVLGQKVSEQIKQNVIYESKPGGGGAIAAVAVKQAAPDGYTLFLGHPGALAINQSLFKALPYDPIKDFEPVIMVTSYPLIMLVPTSIPVQNLRELLAYGKAKSGGLSFGSPAIGATPHLLGEMIRVQSGVPMQHIPYKGAAPALVDLIAGRLDFYFTGYSSARNFVRDGRLRIIAITSDDRYPILPNVPTLTESGMKDLNFGNWQGLVAPAGTPRAVINRLHAEFAKALLTDEMKKVLEEQALDAPVILSPDAFGKLIKSDAERFAQAVKISGARAD